MEWRPKVDYTRLIAGGFGGGTMIRFDFWPGLVFICLGVEFIFNRVKNCTHSTVGKYL